MKTKYFFILIFLKLINIPFLFSENEFDKNNAADLYMTYNLWGGASLQNSPCDDPSPNPHDWVKFGNNNAFQTFSGESNHTLNSWANFASSSMQDFDQYNSGQLREEGNYEYIDNNDWENRCIDNCFYAPEYLHSPGKKIHFRDFIAAWNNPATANLSNKDEVEIFNGLSKETIIKLCDSKINNFDFLLNKYHLYSNQHYLNYIRGPRYDSFILDLYEKIKNPKLKKTLRNVEGFERDGFVDFIEEEKAQFDQKELCAYKRRENERKQRKEHKRKLEQAPRLCIPDSIVLKKIDIETNPQNLDKKSIKRYQQRALAIEQTIKSKKLSSDKNKALCFDYSKKVKQYSFNDQFAQVFDNQYGTFLDKQLHKELCETREKALSLNSRYPNDVHTQIITPAVCYFTAQAKVESDVKKAFNLSDFCYNVTNFLTTGLKIIGTKIGTGAQIIGKTYTALNKGLSEGIQNFESIEHWVGLLTAPINALSTI
ncbi:MAG: hypothetical protein JXA94_05260, partial [Parachlamydiales bacterium]|nr:hypothetical protein [Parachlamydiales bacterium]